MRKLKIAVLTVNRQRAKVLLRDPDSGDLKTCLSIEDGPAPSPLNLRGMTRDERLRRQRLLAFLEVIAEHLKDLASREALEGVVIVAPARLLADLTSIVGKATPVLAAKPKDLMKVPDHEVTDFLRGEILRAERVRLV